MQEAVSVTNAPLRCSPEFVLFVQEARETYRHGRPPGPAWVPRERRGPRARSRSLAARGAGGPGGRGAAPALPPGPPRLPSGPTHSPICVPGSRWAAALRSGWGWVGGRGGGGGRGPRRPGVGRCAPQRWDRPRPAGTGALGPHAQSGWQRSVRLGRPGSSAQRPPGRSARWLLMCVFVRLSNYPVNVRSLWKHRKH